MKKQIQRLIIAVSTLFFVLSESKAQNIGINSTGASPNSSAALDIDMTNKGLLIPRIALASVSDASAITSPATSLLVYNTGGALTPEGYYYNQGTSGTPNWVPFLTNNVNAPAAWSIIGNTGTTAGTNFIGTTDAIEFVIKTDNIERMRVRSTGGSGSVRIGNVTPSASTQLSVTGQIGVDRLGTGLIGYMQWEKSATNDRLWSFVNSSSTSTGGWDFFAADAGFNTSVMRIQNDGNVGIGVSAPSARVHIAKITDGTVGTEVLTKSNFNLNATANTANAFQGTSSYMQVMSASTVDYTYNGSYVNISTFEHNSTGTVALPIAVTGSVKNNSTGTLTSARSGFFSMSNNSTGNIGTANVLHTSFNNASTGTITSLHHIRIDDLVNTGTITNATGLYIGDLTTGTQTNTPFSVYASDANTYNYFAGNLGIGTTSPATLFHVSGSTPNMRLQQTSAGSTAISQTMPGVELICYGMNLTNTYSPAIKFSSTDVEFSTQNPKFLAGIIGRATEVYDADTKSGMALDFLTTSNGSGVSPTPATRMTIDHSGNVGIGTMTPSSNLHIVDVGAGAKIEDTGNNFPTVTLKRATGGSNTAREWTISISSVGNLNFKDVTASVDVLTINTNGNVGISDTSPTQKLDIVGGNGRVESGYSWLTNSDRRYKKNITTFGNSLSKIMKIRGTRYDLISDSISVEGQGKHIGFIAQELEAEFPEFVVTEPSGYKSVAYDKMTAVLVNAIKELSIISEEQQQTIESLKAENLEIKTENKLLKEKTAEIDYLKSDINWLKNQFIIQAERD